MQADQLTEEQVAGIYLAHLNLIGAFIRVHMLLSVLKELKEKDKIHDYIYSRFCCNELNKYNNTEARISNLIYHMARSIFCKPVLVVKIQNFLQKREHCITLLNII